MVAIGIDLGTSNSVITAWDNGEIKQIKTRFGNYLTPSVVGLDETDEMLVGEIAKERLITHPAQTANVFKRFMGTDKTYRLGNKNFSAVELSALVLASLKEDAEKELGKPCEEVIISVPAYFNNNQREATIEAARLAQMNVAQLISEPTAAAIAYGFNEVEEEKILVLDLGGGTFDVSLLEMFEGIMQVEAIAGDNQLGGEDFTRLILQNCLAENNLSEATLTAEEQAVLYQKAERLKINLEDGSTEKIEFIVNDCQYSYRLDLETYKNICQPLLNRMRTPILRTLKDAHTSVEEVDRVILIGGATKDSVVRNFFSILLKKIPYTQINPDEAVSIGAAIQGNLRKQKNSVAEMILTDVCSFTLGVETSRETKNGLIGGLFAPIIERNTTIPVSRTETFYTIRAQQTALIFPIYQGESPKVKDNLKIGELTISLPRNTPANYPVECRFTYDINGLLEVTATLSETGHSESTIIEKQAGKMSQEEMKASFDKLADLKIHPRDRAENRLMLARLERLYAETIGYEREFIQSLLLNFEAVLEKQDDRLTRRTLKELTEKISKFELGEFE